jgi:CheY-like chemotaxis protein
MARILLIEDNEMNRDMLSRRLERRGYQMLITCDGEQGLALAQKCAMMPIRGFSGAIGSCNAT